MKIKKFAAVFAAAAMLTACGNVNEAAVSDISDTSEAVPSETEATTETESETSSEAETVTEASEEETVSETSEESETTAQAAADEQAGDYKAAYKAKLLEMLDENETASAFDLFDMNGDGIPELFVSGGDYHAAGVFAYTYRDGALVNLSADDYAFGSYGEAAVSADGYLTGEYSGMGVTLDYFYKLDGDKLVMISSTETGEIPDGDDYENFTAYYKVNDEDATEEEYNKAFAEYDAHDWVTVGRGNLVSDETINSVLYAE